MAEKGILICKDSARRPSGEGYCVFADEEAALEALKKDNASMGHRYIELFKATKEEALKAKRLGENPEEYEDMRYRALGYGGGPTKNLGFGGGGPRSGSGGGPMMGDGGGRKMGYGNNGGRRGGDNAGFSNQCKNGEEKHIIKMRGVPFKATEMEISEWFSPCASCREVNIMYGPDGRPSGMAEVTFRTEADAKAAMAKHRQNMGSRYIELFYKGGF